MAAIALGDLQVGHLYVLRSTRTHATRDVTIAAPYDPETDSIPLTLQEDGYQIEHNLMPSMEEMLEGHGLNDLYVFYLPGQVPPAAPPVVPAPAPAAAAAAGGAGAGAGPLFINAVDLLTNAEDIGLIEKPTGLNSIAYEEFNYGEQVILIYEGGEHAAPHIYKRAALLAYFDHVLGPGGTQIIRNPNTNTEIIRKYQPLPALNAEGKRLFHNGIYIKTGRIASRYPLRSKGAIKSARKSRHRRNRKSRRNMRRRNQ